MPFPEEEVKRTINPEPLPEKLPCTNKPECCRLPSLNRTLSVPALPGFPMVMTIGSTIGSATADEARANMAAAARERILCCDFILIPLVVPEIASQLSLKQRTYPCGRRPSGRLHKALADINVCPKKTSEPASALHANLRTL